MFAPTVLSICIRRFGDARWVACFLLLENHTHINGYILNKRSKVRTGVRSYTNVLLRIAYQLY